MNRKDFVMKDSEKAKVTSSESEEKGEAVQENAVGIISSKFRHITFDHFPITCSLVQSTALWRLQ